MDGSDEPGVLRVRLVLATTQQEPEQQARQGPQSRGALAEANPAGNSLSTTGATATLGCGL
eukprot:6089603-Heterocapsa_arctica.AAC.1